MRGFTVILLKTTGNSVWQKRESLFKESMFLYSVKLSVCRNNLKIFIELKTNYTELYGNLAENNREFRLAEKGMFA